MHLKQSLLVIFLLISLTSYSQEKYIEVTVSDTAWVIPDQFVYTITVNPSIAFDFSDTSATNNQESYENRQRRFGQKRKLLLDSLSSVLAAKGFYILPLSIEEAYSAFDDSRLNVVHIFSRSFDSVKMLYNAIVNNPAFYGGISLVKAADEAPYYKKLYQKLLAQAKSKAITITELSNLKLGDIISIKDEGQAEKTGQWVAYPPMSAIAQTGYHTTIFPNSFVARRAETANEYKIAGSLTVRFNAR